MNVLRYFVKAIEYFRPSETPSRDPPCLTLVYENPHARSRSSTLDKKLTPPVLKISYPNTLDSSD